MLIKSKKKHVVNNSSLLNKRWKPNLSNKCIGVRQIALCSDGYFNEEQPKKNWLSSCTSTFDFPRNRQFFHYLRPCNVNETSLKVCSDGKDEYDETAIFQNDKNMTVSFYKNITYNDRMSSCDAMSE